MTDNYDRKVLELMETYDLPIDKARSLAKRHERQNESHPIMEESRHGG